MPLAEGLKTGLNQIRELTTPLYQQNVPIITDDMDIGTFGTPIINTPEIMNEFISVLVNRIVYTQFFTKYFNNPLRDLEGDQMPLGYEGQEIYVNPAKGRKFNVNDFAGLLAKYEADVKVQYQAINMDVQYPVTVSRHILKQAFVSWESLDSFIGQLSQSLYNGAYINDFQFTKNLVSSAYMSNSSPIYVTSEVTTEAQAKSFVTYLRQLYLSMQTPSTQYNAWHNVGGYGKPITTWTEASDIIIFLRNDIRAFIDVNVLAQSFNISSAELLGKIYLVDNFNQYDDDGNLIFDGSKILGFIGDKRWFRIKSQDMYLDEFYNANNRTWQYYLNVTKMFNYSLFANGVIIATQAPSVSITSLDFKAPEGISMINGEQEGLEITVTPPQANTPTISYESSNTEVFTVTSNADNDRHCTLTATGAGTATLTAKSGNVTATVNVTVTASAKARAK